MIPFHSVFVGIFVAAGIKNKTFWKIYIRIATSYVTAWKVSKYGVFAGLYLPVFGLHTEIYSINTCDSLSCREIHKNTNLTFTLKI